MLSVPRAPMLLASPKVKRGRPGPGLFPPGIPIFSAKLPMLPVSVVSVVARVRFTPVRASFRMFGEKVWFQFSITLFGVLIVGVVGMERTGFAVVSLRLSSEKRPDRLSLEDTT